MPMNDDDFMAVFTGKAKVSKQQYPVIPTMGTDTPYEERQREQKTKESAIDFSFLDDDSMGTIDKLKKFWRVQTNTQTPDERLESAEKVGNALGLVPQTLAENDDLYKNAVLTYEQQRNNAYLQGKPFTPQTVAQLYPELDIDDTVATTLALRDYNNVLKTREAISQGVPVYTLAQDDSLWGTYKSAAIDGANLPGYLFGKISDLISKGYEAGQAMDQQGELMYKASIGEISDEEVEKQLPGLMGAKKALDEEIGDSYIAKIVGEVTEQLSMQKNMMMRGAQEILAPIMPLAQPVLAATKTNIPQIATLGASTAAGALGATGVAAGATVTAGAALAGLLTLGTASVFVGTYRAEAGQAYWEWRTKKNKFGKSIYTREQAIGHAKRVGVMNAAIETGAWELAFKGIAKVYGNHAAEAVIKNTDAMKKLIGAGRKTIRLQALTHGAKQFAKVAIPETVEEGLQSMTSDLDTNIYGEGGISAKEMFNNALDAMVEAVPSVIGLSMGGSALGGIGAYRAMKKISGLSEMKDAVIEFKRQNENAMLQKVMELRDESSLYHKAPEAYRKTIQKQMDQNGMSTVYIDAQAAAENESTHKALNEMVEKGIVSAKELDESIETGKPLDVESGKYMQLAAEETPGILADYTTMDKGERTLHAIKEERQRYKEMVDIVTSTKEKREAAASEKILNEHFSEDTEKGREDRATAQELLSGGLEHLQENYKSLLEEAKKAWGELSGVKDLQDYMERRKTQDANNSFEKGVDFVDIDQGDSRVHLRVSKNPDWYQDFYGDYGRAPNERELYDIAYNKTKREVFVNNDEESRMGEQELEATKAKVESLERVGEVIKSLDKKDLVAQTLLDPETYEQAYKPLLEQLTKAGNKKVTQAARGSALILAKLAENFHKNYGVPLKLATIKAGEITGLAPEALGQMAGENAETAPTIQLRRAEEMENAGNTPEEIWNKTGWMRGPEGLWRFEIPDYLENIHLGRLSEEPRYIDEIYDNDKLYEAYPELRDTTIRIADLKADYNGEYAGLNGLTIGDIIIIDKSYAAKNDTEVKKTIIHELQHVIQNEFERGFSKGGTPKTAKADMKKTLEMLERALEDESNGSKAAEDYVNVSKKILEEKDFMKGFQLMAERSKIGKALIPEKKAELDRRISQITTLNAAIREGTDYESYRRLGGEAEAFMIEERAELAKERDYWERHLDDFIDQYHEMIENITEEESSKLDELRRKRDEKDKYFMDPNHEVPKLIQMIQEIKTIESEIPEEHQQTMENLRVAYQKISGKVPMPAYNRDSKYGYAVANFGGAELPFSIQAQKQRGEDQLRIDEKEFSKNVDLFVRGKLRNTKSITMMNTPLVFTLVGAEILPLNISYDTLQKVLEKRGRHGHSGQITPKIMKQLPRALADPLMIINTYPNKDTGQKRIIVAVDVKDQNGATIVVPIEFEKSEAAHGYRFNRIVSAYGKTEKGNDLIPKYDFFEKSAVNGDIAYINNKKTANWLKHEQLETLIPHLSKSSSLSAHSIPNETDLAKLKKWRPAYYQTAAPEKDLVVYHNVSADKLKGAIELGGLPMPSLAITKKDIPFGDFGEITLIGNKDMIDPRKSKNNEVFSRDAYTVRKPTVNYEEPSEKDEAAFHKKYSATKEELEKKGIQTRRMDFSAYDGLEALARMENDEVIKYYYVKNVLGKDVSIKKKTIVPDIRFKTFFEKHPNLIKALKDKKIQKGDFSDLDKAAKPYYDSIRDDIANKKGLVGLSKRLLAKWTTDGHINQKGAEDLYLRLCDYEEDLKKEPSTIIDRQAFMKDINQTIEEHGIERFISYVQSEFDNLYKEKYLWDNGKKYKFTLDNIVKLMKKYRGTNNEGGGGINYGFNSLLAFLSKKFTSIRDIKNSKSQLAPNAKELAKYQRAESLYNRLQDEAIELRGDYDESLDMDLAELIKDIRDGKTGNMHGFPKNESFIKHIRNFLEAADKVTTDYFEAKPARKVSFEEFSGAIVPEDTPQKTIDFLQSKGIEVRKYNQELEGDRQAKAEELAHELNVYFQNTGKYQGSYDRNQNVISIFDGANQSTAIHEGAHMFLSMLEDMSNLDEATLLQYFNGDEKAAAAAMKRMQDDLSTIRNWASFSTEHLAEYKGTSLEKEFMQHAADIEAGKEGAEERWIQERFARGFEKYLMDGSAPTKELQGVFRRFKKWLTDIYKTAKNLGNVNLTPEIKDVFDKMIATEDEINAWAAQRKLESIDKAIDVNKSELGNLKEWAENVKQKAQEKAMSYYLSMVKDDALEQFRAAISTEEAKEDFLKSLTDENEIYKIERLYHSDTFPTKQDKEKFLKASGISSEAELQQKLNEAGGTAEERWNKNIEDMVQQYKNDALTPEMVKQMAEDILNSPEGLQKKSRIESMLLEKKVTQYINLVTSMQLKLKRAKDKEKVAREIRKRLGLVSEKETSELDKQSDTIARSEEKISKLEKQVKTLKAKLEESRKQEAEAKDENNSRKESAEILEGNLHAIEAELEKERAAHEKTKATGEDTKATVAELESQLKTMVDGLKDSRKGMWVDNAALRKDAWNTLSMEPISHATSWKWWQNKAREADAKAMKRAAANDWDGVAYYKKVEAQNLIMARQARLNVDEIKKALHGGGKLTTNEKNGDGAERYGILGLINRIGRKENPVLLQGDARYFIQHLAYMCGMVKNDAPMPIDDVGNPRPFSEQNLMNMIDPMKMKELDGASLLFDGSDIIPKWVLETYFNFDSKPESFNKLTMNDFRDIVKCMKAVYKVGRREYEGNTLGTSFDNAAKEILDGLHNVSGLQFATSFQRKYLFTDKQKKLHLIAKYARSLTLPEMYIERLGEAAYKYLYKPIDIATTKQREMKEQAMKDVQKIFKTYSRKEWLEIRNDRKYRILDSNELFSKEEILVIALNWGTESNRERMKDIVREVNPTYDLDKPNWAIDLQEELETYLTDKDWDFVEKIWTHLNSYYAGRSKVQNDLYGVPMGKVPGITFTLKSGRKIHGQYYTIRYDKDLSQRTSEQSVNDVAKQGMKGATTFGVGMGSTKTRTGSGGQILDLSLDLYPKYVDEAIQHVTMREATVDVYKLLCREDVKESITNVMGIDGYDFLKQWVVDNWHSPIVEANDWVGLFNRMRCKFNFATMAYRTSTAVLNALNIFPLMNEMGPMNALYAIAHFYKDIPYAPGRVAERYRFIREKSSFMRGRENNMDRDMAQGMRLPVSKGESSIHSAIENGKFGTAEINRFGFWFITKTDLMLSMPQWLATYEGNKRKLQLEHPDMKIEDIDAEAVRLADKAVRQTFGSGEIKDRPEIMRNGNWLGQITAFYSYTNLVANWFIRDFYKWKDTGSIRPLAESILFCWVLNAVFEGCLRAAWDDKDDDDKYKNKIVNAFFNGGPIGGIPIVRDSLPWITNYLATGKGMGEIAPDVGALDVLNYVPKILQATKKGDYIEAARNVNKISNRTYIGFSDTLSDGFWSTIRFCTTENQYTLSDLIYHIAFDKPLKAETKKSKKKEDKK